LWWPKKKRSTINYNQNRRGWGLNRCAYWLNISRLFIYKILQIRGYKSWDFQHSVKSAAIFPTKFWSRESCAAAHTNFPPRIFEFHGSRYSKYEFHRSDIWISRITFPKLSFMVHVRLFLAFHTFTFLTLYPSNKLGQGKGKFWYVANLKTHVLYASALFVY